VSTKRRKERIRLSVMRAGDLPPQTGVLAPADALAQGRLRDRKYSIGSEVFAELVKPRNPQYNRLMHALAALVVVNVEDFETMDAHAALNRLQLESGAGCEEIGIKMAGNRELVVQRVPLSLSFESMDESAFQRVMRSICNHLILKYWPDTTIEEILEMANEFESGTA